MIPSASRRQFLATSAAALASAAIRQSRADETPILPNRFCYFSKPFNSLSFQQLAEQTTALGFGGIEAPIRRGGHIEADAVSEELPKLVGALARHQCQITIMTSDVNDVRDPMTETVLRTAAKLKIPFYRMKYFKYDAGSSITGQIDRWKGQLQDLAQMNKDLGITGLYQNHSGRNYFGAPVWDMHKALENVDPMDLGVAYDIRHATAEAGTSWPIGFRLLRPHIRAVYVKDFAWGDNTKPVNVPLGEGRIDRDFFDMLHASGFDGPISLHEEYIDHRQPELVPDHWAAIAKDFAVLKSWMHNK